jgi:hypothetical protein
MHVQLAEWCDFPALGEILERKPKTQPFLELVPESDTLFDRFDRHVMNAAQVSESQNDVIMAVRAGGRLADAVLQDIEKLIDNLEDLRYFLAELVVEMDKVRARAHESEEDWRCLFQVDQSIANKLRP